MTCSRPASRRSSRTPAGRWRWTGRTWSPSPGPRRAAPATAPTPRRPGGTARTTCCAARTSCSSGITCPPAIMMPEENGPAVPELARRATVSSCRHDPVRAFAPVLTAMPGQRDPARRHPGRLRLRPPRRRRLGAPAARRRRAARPGPAPARPRPQGHPRRRHHRQRQPLLPRTPRARCWNSGRSPAPPPKSRPRTTTARPPSWPATSSAASPPTTPTATTASHAPPPWARSAARSAPPR